MKVILIILIISLIFILFKKKDNKLKNIDEKISLSFLCIKPNPILVDFLIKLKKANENYDIFLVCDDNSKKYYINNDIKVIQIDRDVSKKAGYHSILSKMWLNYYKLPDTLNWDKVLYYLCNNNNYKYNWIIEEDVFVPTVNTINNIDKKYKKSDLLIENNKINKNGDTSEWLWSREIYRKDKTVFFEPPWYSSMACACRLSNKLLEEIRLFVLKEKTLVFHEIFFNTLAMKKNLIVDTPKELKNIVWKKDYKFSDINKNYLYHPIKDLKLQKEFREKL